MSCAADEEYVRTVNTQAAAATTRAVVEAFTKDLSHVKG